VTDPSPTVSKWKIWREGTPEPPLWNATFSTNARIAGSSEGTWIVKAATTDAAGNQATQRLTFRFDLQAPRFQSNAEPTGSVRIKAFDNESGVARGPLPVAVPPGWIHDLSAKTLILRPGPGAQGGIATFTATDVAGNQAVLVLTLHPPAALDASSAERVGSSSLQQRLEGPAIASDAGGGDPMWWTLGLVASSAASIPLVRRSRRRKTHRRSLARRLRVEREKTGAP
jgi:hypothetical protein